MSHTFGVGRTVVDSWGRGKNGLNPGPGTYDARVEGTFVDALYRNRNFDATPEVSHLNCIERRFRQSQELEDKLNKHGYLTMSEKILLKNELRERTRLVEKKDHFKELIERKQHERDSIYRPRMHPSLDCNSVYSQRRLPQNPKERPYHSILECRSTVSIPETEDDHFDFAASAPRAMPSPKFWNSFRKETTFQLSKDANLEGLL